MSYSSCCRRALPGPYCGPPPAGPIGATQSFLPAQYTVGPPNPTATLLSVPGLVIGVPCPGAFVTVNFAGTLNDPTVDMTVGVQLAVTNLVTQVTTFVQQYPETLVTTSASPVAISATALWPLSPGSYSITVGIPTDANGTINVSGLLTALVIKAPPCGLLV